MKLKQILLIISVFAVSFGAIAQTKNTNASRSKSQTLTEKVQTLEKKTQEDIHFLQTDIQTINNSIDEIKKNYHSKYNINSRYNRQNSQAYNRLVCCIGWCYNFY